MNMQEIECTCYDGEGYCRLVSFENWRVAIANFAAHLQPDTLQTFEKHTKTDEIFVLLNGEITILTAGYDQLPGDICACRLLPGKIYNVKMGVWHAIVLTPQTKILIVENDNTDERNTEKWSITQKQRTKISALINVK